MPIEKAERDECFIVVKAQPHRSSKYFETVCCAGIGRDGKWRRQYPVPFRILADDQKFNRWNWIKYTFITSDSDKRWESQKVQPESLELGSKLKKSERARFLSPLVRDSFSEADEKGESLTLLRPTQIDIAWEEKTGSEIREERDKHETLAQQLSMFDETAKPLEPCPIKFYVHWIGVDGKKRRHECDDWETSTAFRRFERNYGRSRALAILQEKYEEEYFKAGLALAFSTHSRRNVTNGVSNQWLLVGLIRLDENTQQDLFL
jgi:hypothetical protein